MSASGEGKAAAAGYAPHPYVGGRTAVLRALAAWRMRWPGAPRVIVLTGSPGSGCSRLVTGFLMMCDPGHRKQLPLDDLDPATVPPDLPEPAVPSPAGRTAAQLLWLISDHFGLSADRDDDIFTELAAREEPVTLVVPDVDRAGPVRAADEPARVVRDVLKPLAATGTVHLLAEVPRELAAELAGALPSGQAQIIDLDAPEWADPKGLVRHAETALTPDAGAPELPYTTDPSARRALAEALATRADGNRLTVQLAVQSLIVRPEGFDPADASLLPGSVGDVLDLHARRLGADPRTLRLMLAPLAFAEGEGLPVHLWGALASAVAGRDMSRDLADGMLLAAPFIEPVEPSRGTDGGDGEGDGDRGRNGGGAAAGEKGNAAKDGGAGEGRTLLRLMHPGIAEEIRSGLPDVRDAQTKIAMALLEAVPQQDWAQADPYIRDHLAAHTLDAGLLPQLLTDPGLFAHADPVTMRAAIEAVPLEQLGAPARTYLRTAPLLTRSEAPADLRAAFLESAFVEDGLVAYADALHTLGFTLPWRTLWSVPLVGVRAVTTGSLPAQGGDGATAGAAGGPDGSGAGPVPASPAAAPRPVAAFLVPEGTPGARTVTGPEGDASGAGGRALLVHDLLRPGYLDADPAQVQLPSAQAQEAAPYGLSRGADYLRVWARADEEVVAALLSDTPFTGADLSPDGVLVVATARGVTARQILAAAPAPVPAPSVPAQRTGTADSASPDGLDGLEGDHS
ncbi:ATP-binding protein [Streptomyces sp. DSM 41527]|uniref:ATP-binding protein n=1 Tax=Streptomyces mooreae TaxID=3075523 RepID=A0ABU2TBE4_9ACTN|nr:ATP-binding protein [Streptomyces sp. DSM 41527]MDT0458250.1 ATP-binding protein [Streptomyces sp. DSM 41527]